MPKHPINKHYRCTRRLIRKLEIYLPLLYSLSLVCNRLRLATILPTTLVYLSLRRSGLSYVNARVQVLNSAVPNDLGVRVAKLAALSLESCLLSRTTGCKLLR